MGERRSNLGPALHHRRPKIRIPESTYFVTWRLHRSQPELSPLEGDIVVAAMRHFEQSRYELVAFVVMNDHVHVMLEPTGSYSLSAILHSWKSFTAGRFQRLYGRSGAVWQHGYF